jgi:serine/threonine protein kinase
MLPFDRPDGAGYYYWPDSAYTCPESFVEDASFTVRSDVYSLGLTLYVLARRENPFAGHPCTWELNSRVSKNMVNFLEKNPLENCPPLAITIEAMTLCRHDSRPRLRDLEIIFYQLVVMLANKSSAEAHGVSALQTSRATTISKAAADNSEDGQTVAMKVSDLKLLNKRNRLEESSPPTIFSLFKSSSLKTRIQVVFLVLLLLFSLVQVGAWHGRRGLVRKHFQQGPLQVFTCCNGHTATLRTLDLRNVRCPQCNAETSPSYTCNKCKKIFGLTPWPKRDMNEKECAEFEEKLGKCPFCKSTDIKPTEKTAAKKAGKGS